MLELCGYTDAGTRPENQDDSVCRRFGDDRFCAVVADGLGGHREGREASQMAVRIMTEHLENQTELPTKAELLERLERVNREILDTRSGEDAMKSTVVALYVWGNRAVGVHIGDSRLYHFSDGELKHFTLDHSVSQLSVQMGDITRNDIPQHPGRSHLIRVLGERELEPDYFGPIDLTPGQHAFLLCSDGFWEYLYDEELWLDLHKCYTAQEWLWSLCWRRSKRLGVDVDNNTAIAIYYESNRTT